VENPTITDLHGEEFILFVSKASPSLGHKIALAWPQGRANGPRPAPWESGHPSRGL